MKNNFKRAILALICLVVATFAFAACGNKEPQTEQYTVAVSFDQTMGSATLSASASGERYNKGESVTVTVTPNSDCHVASVTVNGNAVTLINSAHTFIVEGNTQINVVFEKNGNDTPDDPNAIPANVLATAQGKVTFDGTYTAEYSSNVDTVLHNITVSFREDTVYFFEQDALTDDVLYYYVTANHNGNAATVYHTANNQIAYIDTATPFEEVANPFNKLQASDFVLTQNGVYMLTGNDKKQEVATGLTGNRENVTDVIITVADDNVTQVDIYSEDNEIDYGTYFVYYDTHTTFTLKHYGTGAVPQYATESYPHESEHATLENALINASNWNSYTVKFSDHNDEEDIAHNIFVTGEAVYFDAKGLEGGYLVRGNSLYTFNYDVKAQQTMIHMPVYNNGAAATINDVSASFGGFSADMFEYAGNGVYRMRPLDYYVQGETSGTVNVITAAFMNLDAKLDVIEKYIERAVGIEIELQDGELHKVTVQYRYAGGGVTEKEGIVTYLYTDVNDTTMPIDTLSAKTIFETYEGDYYGKEWDGTVYHLEVKATDGEAFILTVGDEEAAAPTANIVAENMGGYVQIAFAAYDHIWILFTGYGPRGDGFLLMNDMVDQSSQVVLLPEGTEEFDEGVAYPKSFYGSYSGTYYSGDIQYKCDIEITSGGITITETNLTENVQRVTDIDKGDAQYTFVDGISLEFVDTALDEETGEQVTVYAYYFIVASLYNKDGNKVNAVTFHNEDGSFRVSLLREREEGDPLVPERFLGTYEGNGYKIVAGEEKLTITHNGNTDECEYVGANEVYQLFFTWNGAQYSIYNGYLDNAAEFVDLYDSTETLVADGINRISDSTVPEKPPVTAPARAVGTYEGGGYKIVLEATKLTITYSGNTKECVYTELHGDDLYFIWNDKEYYVTVMGVLNPAQNIELYDSDNFFSATATLTRVEQSNPGVDITIDAQYCGTYTGTYNYSTYVFEIAEKSITVTVDGYPAEVKIISEGMVNANPSITLTINGTEFKIVLYASGGHTVNNATTNSFLFDIK